LANGPKKKVSAKVEDEDED
jgi:hypothetical protein